MLTPRATKRAHQTETSPVFAIVKTGGKQYRVQPGASLIVERLPGEVGEETIFRDVLMIGDGESAQVGTPLIAGACVRARIDDQRRDRKILVFKKRRRKKSRSTRGHRQHQTRLTIQSIETGND